MADGSPNLKQTSMVSVDVFGFARETDEDRQKIALAYEALIARRESAASRHGGRLFASDEDGFMMEMPGADAALIAAEEIATGPWPPVRVGAHQGDAEILPGGDLAGSTVAATARIQHAADRGAVLASEEIRKAVSANLSRRLVRADPPTRFDQPGDSSAVHRLTFVPVVDHEAVRKNNRRLYLTVAGVVAAVSGLVWIVFGRDIATTLNPRHDHVAVLKLQAGGGSKEAAEFAENLTSEIGYVLKQGAVPTVSGAEAETLKGSDNATPVRRLQVGAVLDGSVAAAGPSLNVKLHIDDPVHHRTIWSHEFSGTGDDLKTQVASRVIGVLTCSAQALRPGAKVADPNILTLYLKFCDLDSDAASDASALVEEERILRQLTRTAPDFSAGHAKLALFLISKSEIDPANASALRTEASAEAGRAVTLDAKDSDGYVARARLMTSAGWADREKNLTQALALPAAGPAPRVVYAQMLPEVGRLKDAAGHAQKATTQAPWDADILSFSAQLLAQAGRTDDSDLALTKALQMAPGNPVLQTFRFHIYQWLGRWDDALNILDDTANRPQQLAQEDDLGATKAFLQAMRSGDGGAKAAARDAAYASARRDRSHLMASISHLSALGFTDEAFRLASEIPPSAQSDDLSSLFTPLNAPLRQDPRFMALAARLGLTAYWTASAKWPDFCTASDLPYACATEAAKYASK